MPTEATTAISRPRILLILQLPPPKHGAAFVGECIRLGSRFNEEFDCEYVRISSVPISGHGLVRKIGALIGVFARVFLKSFLCRYDIIYITPCATGLPFYKDYIVAILSRMRARKIVYHFHNKGLATNRFVPRFVKRHFFSGSRVILLSPRLYHDIREFVPVERTYYLANGVGHDGAARCAPQGGDSVNLLFLSNMIRSKGVFTLLAACRILKSRGLSFWCDFAGPWYEITEAEFRASVAENCLEDCVRYLGPKFGAEKEATFAGTDIFAFPSHDECFPLVLLEAMSHGIPVVSTDEGAIPEIIENGREGFIVPPRDPDALADALGKLIVDAAGRRVMGENGREKYLREYTQERFECGLIGVIHNVVVAAS